jgi:glutamyl-Q tRNA(Asp) synthetase
VTDPAGRFAPSPTGPLHAGSLLAATASYLDARGRGALWLLRIDDLDSYRIVDGAETSILKSLEAHQLHWDGTFTRQSERGDLYQQALQALSAMGLLFYCTCSRRDLRGSTVYPGRCRGQATPIPDAAIRLQVGEAEVKFHDQVSGPQSERLAESCGDFVVRRRDGLIAYQLATAVDDGQQAISRVIRGGDLLDNTARQIHLMSLLGLTAPSYAHVGTLLATDGKKLSKQTHAPALDDTIPSANLLKAFGLLGLSPPVDATGWPPSTLLDWGVQHFSLDAVPPGPVIVRH